MTLEQAREHFGNYARIGKAIGRSRTAVWLWKEGGGKIPEEAQVELHRKTRGALRADPEILSKYRAVLRAA